MVRLLSIHKAKGLEFPVVVLAGLHRGTDRRESRVFVQHDWSTGILGVRVGDVQTVGGVFVGAKLAERQRYEQSRVLYVGMTRAKRRLILSAGLPKSIPSDSFLAQIARGLALDLDALGDRTNGTTIPLVDGEIFLQVVQGSPAQRESAGKHAPVWSQADDDVSELLARWEERKRRKQEADSSPTFTSPTALQQRMSSPAPFLGSRRTRGGSDVAQLVGTLAHRVLEGWDYRLSPEQLSERVEELCRREIPAAFAAQADLIMTELQDLFRTFAASAPYAELRRATIVGREVPFSIPWYTSKTHHSSLITHHCVMEGVIDLIYRLDGQIWVADYKTDRLRDDEVAGRVAAYSLQARVYAEAVSRCIGVEKVGFKFLFLRNGLAVQA
jgi:ATP-dependent helicase/nuclease subunit A